MSPVHDAGAKSVLATVESFCFASFLLPLMAHCTRLDYRLQGGKEAIINLVGK